MVSFSFVWFFSLRYFSHSFISWHEYCILTDNWTLRIKICIKFRCCLCYQKECFPLLCGWNEVECLLDTGICEAGLKLCEAQPVSSFHLLPVCESLRFLLKNLVWLEFQHQKSEKFCFHYAEVSTLMSLCLQIVILYFFVESCIGRRSLLGVFVSAAPLDGEKVCFAWLCCLVL